MPGDALARVIADGSHTDRSRAIEAIRAVDRGWCDRHEEYSVTHRLGEGPTTPGSTCWGVSQRTPTSCRLRLPARCRRPCNALDHLANVLLTRLAAVGVAIYPTMDAPLQVRSWNCRGPRRTPLLDAIEHGTTD